MLLRSFCLGLGLFVAGSCGQIGNSKLDSKNQVVSEEIRERNERWAKFKKELHIAEIEKKELSKKTIEALKERIIGLFNESSHKCRCSDYKLTDIKLVEEEDRFGYIAYHMEFWPQDREGEKDASDTYNGFLLIPEKPGKYSLLGYFPGGDKGFKLEDVLAEIKNYKNKAIVFIPGYPGEELKYRETPVVEKKANPVEGSVWGGDAQVILAMQDCLEKIFRHQNNNLKFTLLQGQDEDQKAAVKAVKADMFAPKPEFAGVKIKGKDFSPVVNYIALSRGALAAKIALARLGAELYTYMNTSLSLELLDEIKSTGKDLEDHKDDQGGPQKYAPPFLDALSKYVNHKKAPLLRKYLGKGHKVFPSQVDNLLSIGSPISMIALLPMLEAIFKNMDDKTVVGDIPALKVLAPELKKILAGRNGIKKAADMIFLRDMAYLAPFALFGLRQDDKKLSSMVILGGKHDKIVPSRQWDVSSVFSQFMQDSKKYLPEGLYNSFKKNPPLLARFAFKPAKELSKDDHFHVNKSFFEGKYEFGHYTQKIYEDSKKSEEDGIPAVYGLKKEDATPRAFVKKWVELNL